MRCRRCCARRSRRRAKRCFRGSRPDMTLDELTQRLGLPRGKQSLVELLCARSLSLSPAAIGLAQEAHEGKACDARPGPMAAMLKAVPMRDRHRADRARDLIGRRHAVRRGRRVFHAAQKARRVRRRRDAGLGSADRRLSVCRHVSRPGSRRGRARRATSRTRPEKSCDRSCRLCLLVRGVLRCGDDPARAIRSRCWSACLMTRQVFTVVADRGCKPRQYSRLLRELASWPRHRTLPRPQMVSGLAAVARQGAGLVSSLWPLVVAAELAAGRSAIRSPSWPDCCASRSGRF